MNRERLFPESEFLLSTTDLNSHIKYANESFCDIAGYSLDELKEQPHNKVRHPEMPKAAFKDLWNTIKSGQSWMGPVKNLCKNGDYYWVNAFVTPIRDNAGKVIEYQSVRTVLDDKVKQRAEGLYPKLDLAGTTKSVNRKVDKTQWVQAILFLVLILSVLSFYDNEKLIIKGLLTTLLIVANFIFYIWRSQYKEVLRQSNDIFNNSLMSYLYSGNNDKLGNISLALKMRKAEMRAVVGRVSDDSASLTLTAKTSSKRGNDVASILSSQKGETDQVASAIHQMSATVHEIAKIVSTASDVSQNGLSLSQQGQNTVSETTKSITELSEQLLEVDTAISRLIEGTRLIEEVLIVISSIADQTNLLALNAAIEAARAGEQGRGFAVVAEEVRALAMRSQQSTVKVGKLTNQLRVESDFVINSMTKGRALSASCVNLARHTTVALKKVNEEVFSLAELNAQVATAVEEQAVVAEQINKNITTISNMSSQSENNGIEAANLGADLVERLANQQSLIAQFNR
ncbi:chemotaxis protein [Arsukibacterium sp. MJ3]|uniref:methyl-accepting chemotaxis protein n=1 Tax=Arsukibacterium sp. MJ3 TaxID=1632859 RepID=UPI0006272D28|nr:PAS domain-containing methyl-accepting chemotaxis protein [Arsukibacterium sp. MJ3]KKO48271.1 chemotaxis protein [Arsukibacterium sp. MJ3]